MTEGSDVVAIIPARSGSKGLPGKNTRLLDGKPLYRHSVDAAREAGITRIVITTDIEEIFRHDLPAGVEIVPRPEHLAGDQVTMAQVLNDLLPRLGPGIATVVLLQPTSPLRTAETVRKGLALFDARTTSLVMSVSPADRGVLKWGQLETGRFVPLSKPEYCFANRQSLPEVVRPNGALYVFSASRFLREGDFSAENVKAIQISEQEAIDIDTETDFLHCAETISAGKT
ncbi:cytidylyltransferase domain-containing protein [Roseibium sp.]|uniref:acylneuraminate cytidylyltransferase family protein n=1 Tax=Roseibium sp. TaxID=1936156 RepID=UPI003A96A445